MIEIGLNIMDLAGYIIDSFLTSIVIVGVLPYAFYKMVHDFWWKVRIRKGVMLVSIVCDKVKPTMLQVLGREELSTKIEGNSVEFEPYKKIGEALRRIYDIAKQEDKIILVQARGPIVVMKYIGELSKIYGVDTMVERLDVYNDCYYEADKFLYEGEKSFKLKTKYKINCEWLGIAIKGIVIILLCIVLCRLGLQDNRWYSLICNAVYIISVIYILIKVIFDFRFYFDSGVEQNMVIHIHNESDESIFQAVGRCNPIRFRNCMYVLDVSVKSEGSMCTTLYKKNEHGPYGYGAWKIEENMEMAELDDVLEYMDKYKDDVKLYKIVSANMSACNKWIDVDLCSWYQKLGTKFANKKEIKFYKKNGRKVSFGAQMHLRECSSFDEIIKKFIGV